VQDVLGECYARIEARLPQTPSFRRTHRFCDLDLRRPIDRACGAGERQVAVSDRGRVSACQAAFGDDVAEEAPRLANLASLASNASLVGVAPRLAPLAGVRRTAVDACAGCPHHRSCAGGCPLLLLRRDGHANGRSPFCEVFRFVIPRILRISALELLLDAEARGAQLAHGAAAAAARTTSTS
jgi:radical SAM protein with 4Fe4S-binding SPASM domain